MENNNLTIEQNYVITYNNHFYFEGKKFAFRKKELFNINQTPTHVARSNQGWWIGKKLLTPSIAKSLIIDGPVTVDVTNLQWYDQERLNHVFNL